MRGLSPAFCSRWTLRGDFVNLSVAISLLRLLLSLPLPLGLSFHRYDRPLMCTQDRWGTARWPLLLRQQIRERGGQEWEIVALSPPLYLATSPLPPLVGRCSGYREHIRNRWRGQAGCRDEVTERAWENAPSPELTISISLYVVSSLVFKVCLFLCLRCNIHWHWTCVCVRLRAWVCKRGIMGCGLLLSVLMQRWIRGVT